VAAAPTSTATRGTSITVRSSRLRRWLVVNVSTSSALAAAAAAALRASASSPRPMVRSRCRCVTCSVDGRDPFD